MIEGACLSARREDRFLKQPQYLTATAQGCGFGATCFPTLLRPPPTHSLSLSLTHAMRRKRDLSVAWHRYGRVRSTGNCTMPADTPPISEHRLRSTPSLCSPTLLLLRHDLSKSIATPRYPPDSPFFLRSSKRLKMKQTKQVITYSPLERMGGGGRRAELTVGVMYVGMTCESVGARPSCEYIGRHRRGVPRRDIDLYRNGALSSLPRKSSLLSEII